MNTKTQDHPFWLDIKPDCQNLENILGPLADTLVEMENLENGDRFRGILFNTGGYWSVVPISSEPLGSCSVNNSQGSKRIRSVVPTREETERLIQIYRSSYCLTMAYHQSRARNIPANVSPSLSICFLNLVNKFRSIWS